MADISTDVAVRNLVEGISGAANIPVPGHPKPSGPITDVPPSPICDHCGETMILAARREHSNRRGLVTQWMCRNGHLFTEHRSLVR